jgi:tRNA U34 5-carboxymethylaminomethyl modifying GTPase MnmE/TrmE
MSIALDLPGTTRDYVGGRIELAGLVVEWYDTPGLQAAADAVEAEAAALARPLMESCDLLIAMTDPAHEWPDLPRPADLKVASKCDLGRRGDAELAIGATSGAGLADLVRAVRDRLVPPGDLAHPGPWLFDERLAREGPTRAA